MYDFSELFSNDSNYFHDPRHLNNLGNKELATHIFKVLKKDKYFTHSK